MDWKSSLTGLVCLAAGASAPAADSLLTARNQPLFLPAATLITNGVPGLTNAPSRLMVSGISSTSTQGGRVTLITTQVWAKFYGAAEQYNQALALVIDRSNNVCITGYSIGSGTYFDFVTIKYAPDGTAVWTNRYDGPAHEGDFAQAIAADDFGNFYVNGSSVGLNGGQDVVTVKYSPQGIQLWANRYNRYGTNDHYPAGMATDAQGNAYVSVGTFADVPDYTTIKYDALGNSVWTNRYDASDYPVDIVVDPAGDVLVTGASYRFSGAEITTLKYAGHGSALWTNRYSPGVGFTARSMVVDRQANVTVLGENGVGLSTTHYYAAVKYAKDGTLLWTNLMTGPTYQGGNVPQLAIDPAGNVFIMGGSPGVSGDNADFTTVKLAPNGTLLWTNRFIDPNVGNQAPGGIAVDSAGNFYLAAQSTGPAGIHRDLVTIKYAADGTRVWTNRFNGPANADDVPSAAAVDGTGSLYITGYTEPPWGVWNYLTVKYAEYLLYTPPTNFVGSDTFAFTATDDLGQTATGTVSVDVLPPLAFHTSPLHLRLTTAGFQLRVENALGTNPVIIYASPNLTDWQPVLTNPPISGAVPFLDSSATNLSTRFYRALQVP